MVITSLQGGLGNQMFQYAAGYSLAKRLDTTVGIDTKWFFKNKLSTKRNFELNIFNIPQRSFSWWEKSLFIQNKIYTTISEPSDLTISQEYFSTNKRRIFLSGYWQSEKYFLKYEKQIRELFTFPAVTSESVKDWVKLIKQSNAVSVHVRRGDYANNPLTKEVHGLLTLSYYSTAISYITSHVKKPTFYVFSDDLEWVKENLKCDFPIQFVTHDGADYDDMRLMSLCKYYIIANSSFSWWGAWLNSSNDKIVIAPKKWFHTSTINVTDRFPKTWKILQ